MATRSTIAIENADGTIQQVYCHWDGYLSNNGKILLEHYSDPNKLQELIAQGSISVLAPEIGKPVDVNDPTAVFYARDRGEELTVNQFADYKTYCEELCVEEFNYILRSTGEWEFTILDVGVVRSVAVAWANEQAMYG